MHNYKLGLLGKRLRIAGVRWHAAEKSKYIYKRCMKLQKEGMVVKLNPLLSDSVSTMPFLGHLSCSQQLHTLIILPIYVKDRKFAE